jgi:ribosomal protein L11 methylase PrmA
VLLEHLPHYNNLLEKHGDLLLSGILNEDEELLMRAINKLGLSLVNKSQKGNWSLLHYKKG